jgi:Protein of unknown function (DUF5672)
MTARVAVAVPAHLGVYAGAYHAFAVLPEGLRGTIAQLPAKRFAARSFRSTSHYSRLLLSDEFYASFSDYDYVLVHQLDCLLFADELAEWCERGFDYVGAPWTRRNAAREPYFTDVGNGGLSLRRVESCRRVLAKQPRRVRDRLRNPWPFEDKFWSLEAPRLDPTFTIPPAEVAVSFAFETEPRFCFEANGQRLPFGCHGWTRHDPEFWRPHLLPP